MIYQGECLECGTFCIRDEIDGKDCDVCPVCGDILFYEDDSVMDLEIAMMA